jgi:hypothetical protein
MDGVFVLGVMHNARGHENNVTRNEIIGFIIDKIAASATLDKIDLKKIVVVLFECMLASIFGYSVTMKIKFSVSKIHLCSPP